MRSMGAQRSEMECRSRTLAMLQVKAVHAASSSVGCDRVLRYDCVGAVCRCERGALSLRCRTTCRWVAPAVLCSE